MLQALDLDDSDLNLWYKIAQTGMKIVNLNLAISAFQEVIKFWRWDQICVTLPLLVFYLSYLSLILMFHTKIFLIFNSENL